LMGSMCVEGFRCGGEWELIARPSAWRAAISTCAFFASVPRASWSVPDVFAITGDGAHFRWRAQRWHFRRAALNFNVAEYVVLEISVPHEGTRFSHAYAPVVGSHWICVNAQVDPVFLMPASW
jgi:hypothetical protein